MQPTPFDLYEEGWSLIPINADKRPMISTWTPYQTERPSLEQLEQWIRELNPPVWGAPTGEVSKRFTLDFDGAPGRATLDGLGWEPHRATPNGGYHVDFLLPNVKVKSLNHKSKRLLGQLYPGMDSRGSGGYINILGSTASGPYKWLTDNRSAYDPNLVPKDLMDLITGVQRDVAPQGRGTNRSDRDTRTPVLPSNEDRLESLLRRALDESTLGRNNAGFGLACDLRDFGLSRHDAEVVMRLYYEHVPVTNPVGIEEPYEWREALASLDSAFSQESHDSVRSANCPEIVVNGRQLSDISDESLAVLAETNDPPTIFRRGGEKVTVRSDENGRNHIEGMPSDLLRHHLSQKATWVKVEVVGSGDDVPPVIETTNAYPPLPVMKDLLARDWDSVPVLIGLSEIPILRPDGSMLATNGYDAESRIWMDLPEDLDVPTISENPTHDDVQRSIALLGESISEFPFADEASRANALGLILSTVFRAAIPGLIPMAVIDAPVAGTGKTFLVSLASVIATGRPAPLSAAPNGNDEELRKRLTAAFMTDEPLIVFDNVDRQLKSPILAQAITSETWMDRILGASKNVDLTQHAVWVATGNNVEISGDLPRRCYVIRLDPKLAQPARRAFARPDLMRWTREHRGDLLWAYFTLARYWFVQGKREPSGSPWATFDDWRLFIGGIFQTAEIGGFLANLDELQHGTDPDMVAWGRLLEYWHQEHEGQPVSTKTLSLSLTVYGQSEELPRSLAESIDRASGDSSRVTRLSRALSSRKGRYFTD
ncbi:MAG: hypothetical protein ACLQRH_16960, partial [Acidimicrobiales bacterium]